LLADYYYLYPTQIFRACLLDIVTTLVGTVPLNITRPLSGTWETQTLGWKQFSPATTTWILIPGIFMTCSTLGLVIVAIYRHKGEIYSDSYVFDPSNPLHLIAAAAAGGLNNVLRGFRERDIDDGGKVPVLLGSVPGRGPALVRADTYAPVLPETVAPQSF
jgi:hypothetical protein